MLRHRQWPATQGRRSQLSQDVRTSCGALRGTPMATLPEFFLSGVSLATGTINQAGQFRVTLTSAMGQGPVGTVTGAKSPNGKIDATMTGEGCANMKLHFNPIDNLKLYNPPLHGD